MTALCTALPEQLSLLLVDDHRIFLDGLSLALAPLCADLQIRTAESAAAAEACLLDASFDLILLDLRLPDMPGLELLQRWQQQGRMTPVAILSASDSNLDAQAAMAAGALGFIPKSANSDELRQAVTRVLLGKPCRHRIRAINRNSPPADGNSPIAGRGLAEQVHQPSVGRLRRHGKNPSEITVSGVFRTYPYGLCQCCAATGLALISAGNNTARA